MLSQIPSSIILFSASSKLTFHSFSNLVNQFYTLKGVLQSSKNSSKLCINYSSFPMPPNLSIQRKMYLQLYPNKGRCISNYIYTREDVSPTISIQGKMYVHYVYTREDVSPTISKQGKMYIYKREDVSPTVSKQGKMYLQPYLNKGRCISNYIYTR